MESKKWLQRDEILENIQIGRNRLMEMVENGWVRSVKFEPAKRRSCRVYYVDDVNESLMAIANGREPKIRTK